MGITCTPTNREVTLSQLEMTRHSSRSTVCFDTEFVNQYIKVLRQKSFGNNGSHDIVTPKTMSNHNIISRNEENRSKLVILQSFSVLCYTFRKWEHFQITKFNLIKSLNLIWLEASLFPYKSSEYFWDLNCHQMLHFNATDFNPGSLLVFPPALPISTIHKAPSIKVRMGRSHDLLLQKAYRVPKCDVIILQIFPFAPLNIIMRYAQQL